MLYWVLKSDISLYWGGCRGRIQFCITWGVKLHSNIYSKFQSILYLWGVKFLPFVYMECLKMFVWELKFLYGGGQSNCLGGGGSKQKICFIEKGLKNKNKCTVVLEMQKYCIWFSKFSFFHPPFTFLNEIALIKSL